MDKWQISFLLMINHNKVREDHPRSTPICRYYRIGKCNKGENCEFRHPEKCIKYCRNGRDGCGGGFRECQLLHPVLCRNSLRSRECFDMNCTLAHLKGTIRKPVKNDFRKGYDRTDQRSSYRYSRNLHETKPQWNAFQSRSQFFPTGTDASANVNQKRPQQHVYQDYMREWIDPSVFPPLIPDSRPQESTFIPTQSCVAPPIAQQFQSKCADIGSPTFLELQRGMEEMQKQISSIVALLPQITQNQQH